MARPLRILVVDENEEDLALILRELQRGGYEPVTRRVETPVEMQHALRQETWDVVLSDWSLSRFSALFALEMMRSQHLDVPFIIVSGMESSEEDTILAMKAGAYDFVRKQCLARLPLTIERELLEANNRKARRKAEAALAASEERLRLVGRATNDAVRDWDLLTSDMWWNEGFFALFGYQVQDIEAGVESWYSRLYPVDRERVTASCYAAINGSVPTWSEGYRFRRADGTYAEVLDRCYIVRNLRGQALRVIGSMTDLTAVRNAQVALQESQARVRTVLASSLDAIIGTDENGTITDWNPTAEMMFGQSRDEMLGLVLTETIIPSDQREAYRSGLRRFSETGEWPMLNRRLETSALRREGAEFPVEMSIVSLKEEVTYRFYWFVVDISERKQAENRATDAYAMLNLVVNNIPLYIFWKDRTSTFLGCNRLLAQFAGVEDPQAVIGKNDFDFDWKDTAELYRADDRAVMETNTPKLDFEEPLTKPDGKVLWVRTSKVPLQNREGAVFGVLGIFEDITQRKQEAATLRRTEEQLRQVQKMEAIGQLAGGVAHDFNNLLTVITGYTDLLMSDLPADAPMLENLEEIKNTTERASWLTRQLLAFSRRQILEVQILDLNSLIGHFEKMLHRLISEDIVLKTELAPALSRIKADPGQIEQIIMNLVVNACDAMPGGGHLAIETDSVLLDDSYPIKSVEVPPGRYVLLAVNDTGRGMDDETQKRIFEPFFTTKEAGKGTGLGLSTVYGIVKQSNGFIWVYSEPGRGTTFKMYFPAVDENIQAAETKPRPAQRQIGVETILLAEDDVALRAVTRTILERSGYTVLVASNLDEAMKTAEAHNWAVHLLLTDVIMPGGYGPEVADRLKARCSDLKILYTSGYTGTAMSQQEILKSGSQLLQKPYSLHTLLQKVREVLDKPDEKKS